MGFDPAETGEFLLRGSRAFASPPIRRRVAAGSPPRRRRDGRAKGRARHASLLQSSHAREDVWQPTTGLRCACNVVGHVDNNAEHVERWHKEVFHHNLWREAARLRDLVRILMHPATPQQYCTHCQAPKGDEHQNQPDGPGVVGITKCIVEVDARAVVVAAVLAIVVFSSFSRGVLVWRRSGRGKMTTVRNCWTAAMRNLRCRSRIF